MLWNVSLIGYEGVWSGLNWFRKGTDFELCENGNELSEFNKVWGVSISSYQLFKKDPHTVHLVIQHGN
jgi:hypothetical protein